MMTRANATPREQERGGHGEHGPEDPAEAEADPRQAAAAPEAEQAGLEDPLTPEAGPAAREAFGFGRTVCGCDFCKVPCRHLPGTLDPADLPRLGPAGPDLFRWAEVHLRAQTDKPYPALVPARNGQGHCHWYFDGRCAVHANAPYGCAFFDCHMAEDEVARRAAATVQTIRADAMAQGPYWQVWRHLCRQGLTAPGGDRAAVAAEIVKVRRRAEGRRRRVRGG
jgi:hypothetical protein